MHDDLQASILKLRPIYAQLNRTLQLLFILDLEAFVAKYGKVLQILDKSERDQPLDSEDFNINLDSAYQPFSLWEVIEDLIKNKLISEAELETQVSFGYLKKSHTTYYHLIGLLSKEEEFAKNKNIFDHLFKGGGLQSQYKDKEGPQKVRRIIVHLAKRHTLPWLRDFRVTAEEGND